METSAMEKLFERAKEHKVRMVLPESTEERILQAARRALDMGILQPILLGDPDEIHARAKEVGVPLDGIELSVYPNEEQTEKYIEEFVQKCDLYSTSAVKRRMKQPLNYAAMMVSLGDADCAMAGITYTTGEVILAGQMFIGMQENVNTASSIGFLDVKGFEGSEGNLLGIADCAVCPQPDEEDLADIAIASADTANKLFGWEPRVAMLSFSTCGSSEHERIDTVRAAIENVKARRPDILIDGEFQLDAAIIPAVAARKVPYESPVAGKANIVIFPDLGAGNIGVKIAQIFAKSSAYGPVLQGFAKPIGDFSRSAPVDEMLGNMAMVALRARED